MNDNAFLALIIPVLGGGLLDAGVSGIKVKQSYQPTQQGAESGPAAYLHKIGDVRRGSAAVSERWDAGQSAMIRTETQQMETTWQMDARVPQNPADETALTPADVVNAAAMVMASRSVREVLTANGLGILRITDVRNPFNTDDSDRQAAAPSFDFTITHEQVLTTTVPTVETTEFRLARV